MSNTTEIDLIQFTAGPHRGNYAVLVEDDRDSSFLILDRDGAELLSWNGRNFFLDRAEWPPETVLADEWITQNPWVFVDPTTEPLKSMATDILDKVKLSRFVVLFANAPMYTNRTPSQSQKGNNP